jgi:CO/xanthine dehydrogenase Mo-binding subunit
LAALHMRDLAVQQLASMAGVQVSDVLQNADGSFAALDRQATYAELAQDSWWDSTINTTAQRPHDARAMQAVDQRHDVTAKVMAEFEFIQDLQISGMLYGYVGRPRTATGRLQPHAAEALIAQLQALPGVVKVVHDGQLLGVLANTEHAVLQAAQRLHNAPAWVDEVAAPPTEGWGEWLKAQPLHSTVVHTTGVSDVAAISEIAPESIATDASLTVLEAEFERPYLQHASIGLCCALAHKQDQQLHVWSHTQGMFNLQRDLALAFGLGTSDVTVTHVQGAGCYGHNGADDVAFDAAWLAHHTAQAVRVMWTRDDEMRHSPLAPAMTVKVRAGVDPTGRVRHWTQEVWSQGHGTRPGRGSTPSLLGAWQTAHPAPVPLAVNAAMAVGGGSERNAVPPYDIAQQHIVNHRVLAMPLRVSALRALGAPVNVLAAESMMDMVAQHVGQDVFSLRLAHLQDERARAVIRRLQDLSAEARTQSLPEGCGWGMAYARYKNTGAYCAVWAQVRIDHAVHLEQLMVVADVGQVISPVGVRLQLEGGALQAASWTLREGSTWNAQGVQSVDWESYEIDSFNDLPVLTIDVIDRSNNAPLGAGECASGPTTAALANAVSQALGLRVRSLPLRADRLMQLLQTD